MASNPRCVVSSTCMIALDSPDRGGGGLDHARAVSRRRVLLCNIFRDLVAFANRSLRRYRLHTTAMLVSERRASINGRHLASCFLCCSPRVGLCNPGHLDMPTQFKLPIPCLPPAGLCTVSQLAAGRPGSSNSAFGTYTYSLFCFFGFAFMINDANRQRVPVLEACVATEC